MTLDHLKNSAILTNLFRMEEDDDLKGASEFIRSKRKLVARACWGGVEVGGVVADGLDKRYRLTDFSESFPSQPHHLSKLGCNNRVYVYFLCSSSQPSCYCAFCKLIFCVL